MDAFPDRHPYRCLPLNMANTTGWEILCPFGFSAEWNGGPRQEDIVITPDRPQHDLAHFVTSHFSRGVLTMHPQYLFRTPPGWSILVSGPFNRPKQNAYALTGIIESDWLPYPFTMNWQIMSPGTVRFEKGEPFCTIMPIPKNYIDGWDMVVHDLADDPVIDAEQQTFRESRDSFMKKINAGDDESLKKAWQRHYFVGRHPDGTRVELMRLAKGQEW